MGRASRAKRSGAAGAGRRIAWQPDGEADPDAVIWIESVPRDASDPADAPVLCRMSWDGLVALVPAEVVAEMSRKLMQAAAQAQVLGVLMQPDFGLDATTLTGFMQEVVNRSTSQTAGEILMVLPVGSMSARQGLVMIKAVGGDERQAVLAPEAAYQMAVDWAEVVAASEYDEAMHESLKDVSGLDVERRNQVMTYAKLIRATRSEPEKIREAQRAELRKIFAES